MGSRNFQRAKIGTRRFWGTCCMLPARLHDKVGTQLIQEHETVSSLRTLDAIAINAACKWQPDKLHAGITGCRLTMGACAENLTHGFRVTINDGQNGCALPMHAFCLWCMHMHCRPPVSLDVYRGQLISMKISVSCRQSCLLLSSSLKHHIEAHALPGCC